MAQSLKIILFITFLILIGIGGFFGSRYYQDFSQPRMQAVQAVPSTSLAFIESADIKEAIYPFFHADFWQPFHSIAALKKLEDQYQSLDSLLRNHGGFNEMLEHSVVIWALHKIPDGNTAQLIAVELPAAFNSSDVRDFIEEHNGSESIIMKTSYRDAEVYTVNLHQIEKIFYFTIFKGLFLAGFNRDLLHLSIDELYKVNPLTTDVLFKKIRSTAGKNVALNLYVRLPGLLDWMSDKLEPKLKEQLKRLQGLGYWSETDLLINSDNLLLNGYTICNDTVNAGLNLFKESPGPVKIPGILPYNVNWMLHYSIKNAQAFVNRRFENPAFKKDWKIQKKKLSDAYSIDIMQDLVSMASGEIAVVEIAASGNNPKGNLVIIQSDDILGAVLKLEQTSKKVNRKSGLKTFQSSYQEFTIKALSVPGLFKPVFGQAFPDFKINYYIAIKDYLVFSDNPKLLVYLLKKYYARNTLAEDANYQSFSNNISDKSNIYLYANIKRSLNKIPDLFNGTIREEIDRQKSSLGNFEAIALQFSYINQMFYTNVFLKYNPDYQEVIPDSWESELEDQIHGKPFLLPNHRSGKLNVLATDANNKMYLLDHVGNIQWTKQLPSPILGEVHSLDFYGNGKVQYLFNTDNFIYLLDINGHDVEDYPHTLPTQASAPLAVFDYNNDHDYRILVGLTDMRIYNWDKRAEAVEGWNKIKTRSEVVSPVQHLVNAGKDYLFVTDKDGRVIITTRRGEKRIQLKQQFVKATNSVFYVNETNNKGSFITTDETGQLVYISANGNIGRTSFGTFSKAHFFFYQDVDNNGSMDFIFVDGNKLQIFDKFKKILFEHDFPEIINQAPVLHQSGGRFIMGFLLPVSGEIRFYTVNGRLFENLILKGNTAFSTGSIQGDLKLNLITGIENKVVNYSLSADN